MKTLQQVGRYISQYWPYLVFVILFSFLSVLFQILIPIQIGQAVNEIVGPHQVDLEAVLDAIGRLLCYVVLTAGSQYIQAEAGNRLTYRTSQKLRRDIFFHIQELPISSLDKRSQGDIVSLAINDVDQVSNGLLQGFANFFTGVMTIIGVLWMMLALEWKIALIVMVLTPISVVVSSFIVSRNYKRYREQMAIRGEFSAYINEMVSNQDLVKSLNYQEKSQDRMKRINEDMHESGFWSQFYGALISPTTRVLNSVVYSAVGIVGAYSVLSGQLSVGIFSSFLSYANQYTKPFNDISNVINEMTSAVAAAERIFSFLALDSEETIDNPTQIKELKGEISVQNVSFSYTEGKDLIRDFNLEVEPGQTVAIVGPTGSGKSTLINLFMRFYDPDDGAIYIDGVNILDMDRNDLRLLFGMVLQDSWIFEGSVRDNIAYGKKDASEEEIIQAAKQANVHDLILKMENGYDSLLEEGGHNLSSGERQLINIARILLVDPEMLILDEATSSIDSLTEQKVQEAFDRMMEGRTCLIVAHRLSTIQKSDVILYVEEGQVKEQGSHEELLSKEGAYYRLYHRQFQEG